MRRAAMLVFLAFLQLLQLCSCWFIPDTTSTTTCPYGWIALKNASTCIRFNDNLLNWADARDACYAAEGDLLIIDSNLMRKEIKALLKFRPKETYWFGLNDIENEGVWWWTDKYAIPQIEYSTLPWGKDQPDNLNNEDCGQINYPSYKRGKWSDGDCELSYKSICQSSRIDYPVYYVTWCPEGWIPNLVRCIRFNDNYLTWADARAACQDAGGDLLTIEGTIMQQEIKAQLVFRPREAYWFGLNDIENESVWWWNDFHPVSEQKYPRFYWGNGQPNNLYNEDCGQINFPGFEIGQWSDGDCEQLSKSICQRHNTVKTFYPVAVCPEGWIRIPKKCIRFNDNSLKWSDARAACQDAGGDLLTIEGTLMQEEIKAQMVFRPVESYWFGLNDIKEKGVWWWNDLYQIAENTYSRMPWAYGQPTILYYNQNCGQVLSQALKRGQWDVENCRSKFKSICQSSHTENPTYPFTCPEGWIPYAATCILFNENLLKWRAARAACQFAGGDLLTIEGELQHQEIKAQLVFRPKEAYWFGLNDIENEGVWWWNDFYPVAENHSTLPWGVGQPSIILNIQDCGQINSLRYETGQWNDMTCNSRVKSICQKPQNGRVINCPHSCTEPYSPKSCAQPCPHFAQPGKTCPMQNHFVDNTRIQVCLDSYACNKQGSPCDVGDQDKCFLCCSWRSDCKQQNESTFA